MRRSSTRSCADAWRAEEGDVVSSPASLIGDVSRKRGWRRASDAAIVLLVAALAVGTIALMLLPDVAPALVDDRVDIAIITSAALIATAVAALAWGRGRVENDAAAVLRGAAFGVLALLNGVTLAVYLVGADAALGASLSDPGQLPLICAVVGRGLAALLLVLAGYASVRGPLPLLRPGLVLVGPMLILALVMVLGVLALDRLPAFAPLSALDALADDPTRQLVPGTAPLLVLAQGAIAVAFLLAAGLAYRSFRASGRAGDILLGVGLLIAAFSQVHAAIHPGSYSSLVTSGDFLRLAFYAVLLVGIVVDSRADLADLRRANLEVGRLAEAELAAVTLEERARLAREIHDGLAQDLWYAKLKQGRLAQTAQFDEAGQQLSDEVGEAIDNALAEARSAVAAMRAGGEAGPLLDMLERLVEDFSDRFALQAELTVSGPEPDISPRAQAEVMRIVQEALTNARKHADATVLRVAVATGADLRITVSDNGRGFRPEAVTEGFGLDSMRQRADLVGGTLEIMSEERGGSRVELVMPISRREDSP